jgi:hypothetical protein
VLEDRGYDRAVVKEYWTREKLIAALRAVPMLRYVVGHRLPVSGKVHPRTPLGRIRAITRFNDSSARGTPATPRRDSKPAQGTNRLATDDGRRRR